MINISSKIPITGIYKILSPSGKVYIGQSINIYKRWLYVYKNSKLTNRQPKLYNSLSKYGWDAHQKEILEECSIEQLNERETYWKQYYLNQVNGDWNKVLFCDLHDQGSGPRSDKTKQKISKSQLGNNYRLGKLLSNESKTKISNSKKGQKYGPKSDEHKQKLSIALKNRVYKQEWKDKLKEAKKRKKTSLVTRD